MKAALVISLLSIVGIVTPSYSSTEESCSCHPYSDMTQGTVTQTGDTLLSTSSNWNSSQVEENMVFVPGMKFYMGTSEPLMHIDGEDRRRAKVKSFFIDKFEVSNADYALFVEDTGYLTDSEKYGWSFVFRYAIPKKNMEGLTQAVKNAEWWVPVPNSSWRLPEGPDTDVFATGRANHPVVHISWNDAAAFCRWRNNSRLPTEAEWELAAGRGRDGVLFPWGNKILPNGTHMANIFQGVFPGKNSVRDGYESTAPVDSFPPQNELGLHHIVGNAWEWVDDLWAVDHTRSAEETSPERIERTKKGGSFLCHKSFCYRYRVAARHHSTPDSATSNSGFRCAKDAY